jgi:uncharacterized membrane protein YoaK (UPF0700 family)
VRAPAAADQAALILLAAASGAVDAIAFTALGHVFAGVMTGNLALLGIAAGDARPADTGPPLLALAGFVLGTFTAASACRNTRAEGSWPPRVLGCLAGEAVLLAVDAVVWARSAAAPGSALRDLLLFLAAVAMGGQSGAMLAAGSVARPSTYLTGSLATFITRGAGGAGGGADRWVPVRLVALVAGAASAAVLHRAAPPWTAALPPALVALAVLTAARPATDK